MLDFNQISNPIFEQLVKLTSQNQKLKEARDILLPRLMNRTIEV
jgi:type I restriction enzyme S subunit